MSNFESQRAALLSVVVLESLIFWPVFYYIPRVMETAFRRGPLSFLPSDLRRAGADFFYGLQLEWSDAFSASFIAVFGLVVIMAVGVNVFSWVKHDWGLYRMPGRQNNTHRR